VKKKQGFVGFLVERLRGGGCYETTPCYSKRYWCGGGGVWGCLN